MRLPTGEFSGTWLVRKKTYRGITSGNGFLGKSWLVFPGICVLQVKPTDTHKSVILRAGVQSAWGVLQEDRSGLFHLTRGDAIVTAKQAWFGKAEDRRIKEWAKAWKRGPEWETPGPVGSGWTLRCLL